MSLCAATAKVFFCFFFVAGNRFCHMLEIIYIYIFFTLFLNFSSGKIIFLNQDNK